MAVDDLLTTLWSFAGTGRVATNAVTDNMRPDEDQ
jgi:hypothetical protein